MPKLFFYESSDEWRVGFVNGVVGAISSGGDINQTNGQGCTALHVAVRGHRSNVVKTLLSMNANASLRNSDGDTALRIAVLHGYHRIVRVFCEAGVDMTEEVHTSEDGSTLLVCAVEHAHLEVTELLIEHGLDPSIKHSGVSMLHMAARNDTDVRILKLLLENEVNVDSKTDMQDTALKLASRNGNLCGMTLLLKWGADVNMKDRGGNTPLHFSVISGYPETIQLLLDCGADIRAKNKSGVSVLHCASVAVSTSIATLICNGANLEERDQDMRTPFLSAVDVRNDAAVRLLMNADADVTVVDMDGNSAIHFAARDGDIQLVNKLIHLGVPVNRDNLYGQNPLRLAISAEGPSTDGGIVDHQACETVILLAGGNQQVEG
jgi:ankyrin repeat protein